MTALHHPAKLGLAVTVERINPAAAEKVTRADGRPANWTPLMVLSDNWTGRSPGAGLSGPSLGLVASVLKCEGLERQHGHAPGLLPGQRVLREEDLLRLVPHLQCIVFDRILNP